MERLLDNYTHRDWQTTTSGTIRFALIGLGWWTTERVLPAITETESCQATVVVSGSEKKASRAVSEWETVEHGITYDEFHDGEAFSTYDAVYVCTPNAYHLEYVRTAVDLGKPVLCEKPMEATVDRASDLVETCNDAGIELMIGYRMQTDPLVRHARGLIRRGAIGRPVQVLGNNSQTLLDIFPDHDQWRLDRDVTGYGTSVMDLGIYPLNTARFLLDSDPVRVQAMTDSSHEAFTDVPDERSVFSVRLDNGTFVTATSSQNAYGSTSLRVIGTEGQLVFEPAFHMETDLRIEREENEIAVTLDRANQMTELFDYCADRLLSDAEIGPDGRHGLVDMRTMRAIYRAAESGDTINLES